MKKLFSLLLISSLLLNNVSIANAYEGNCSKIKINGFDVSQITPNSKYRSNLTVTKNGHALWHENETFNLQWGSGHYYDGTNIYTLFNGSNGNTPLPLMNSKNEMTWAEMVNGVSEIMYSKDGKTKTQLTSSNKAYKLPENRNIMPFILENGDILWQYHGEEKPNSNLWVDNIKRYSSSTKNISIEQDLDYYGDQYWFRQQFGNTVYGSGNILVGGGYQLRPITWDPVNGIISSYDGTPTSIHSENGFLYKKNCVNCGANNYNLYFHSVKTKQDQFILSMKADDLGATPNSSSPNGVGRNDMFLYNFDLISKDFTQGKKFIPHFWDGTTLRDLSTRFDLGEQNGSAHKATGFDIDYTNSYALYADIHIQDRVMRDGFVTSQTEKRGLSLYDIQADDFINLIDAPQGGSNNIINGVIESKFDGNGNIYWFESDAEAKHEKYYVCKATLKDGKSLESVIAEYKTNTSQNNPVPSVSTTDVMTSPVPSTTPVTTSPTFEKPEIIRDVRKEIEMAEKYGGKLFLQVEDRGRIWYVSPDDGLRYEVTFENALPLFQKLALGINTENLNKLPVGAKVLSDNFDSDNDGFSDKVEALNGYNPYGVGKIQKDIGLMERMKGKLLLQTDNGGRIWYVDHDGYRYEVTWGNLMVLFETLSVGITNADLEKISVGTL